MKFIKFGFGRATDQLCIEIRAGRMSREEAIENLKNSSEGEVPWKFVPDFLEYLNISKEEFEANLDKFTNRRLFFCDDSGRLIKDSQGNLKRRYPLWEL